MTYLLPRRLTRQILRPFESPESLDALRGIDLTVRRGQKVAIFGENGAGKTTLLKVVAGLLFPTRGEVLIGERDTVRNSSRVRYDVGYVINEERSFYWRLTGFENLEFFAALENMFGASARGRIRELIARVGLEPHADRRVAEYSTGMKQRLALARGLLTRPNVLLLDEPTRSLDPIGTVTLYELLQQTLDPQQTVIIATNRVDDAVALSEHIAVLRHGRITAFRAMDRQERVDGVANFVREQLVSAGEG